MSKLFLTSLGITEKHFPAFQALFDRPLAELKVAYTGNAQDPYPEHEPWMDENQTSIEKMGMTVTKFDLREFVGEGVNNNFLDDFDALWCGGGNSFYLRWILNEVGLDDIITRRVDEGMVYGGASAGAIIAGPTLQRIEVADDPAEAPRVIYNGLGLTRTVIVPHYEHPDYGDLIQTIKSALDDDGYDTLAIRDDQVAVLSDGDVTVLS